MYIFNFSLTFYSSINPDSINPDHIIGTTEKMLYEMCASPKNLRVVKETIIFKVIRLPNANKQNIKNVNSKDPLVYHHTG